MRKAPTRQQPWWLTADTTAAAAGQLIMWCGLLALSAYAVVADPAPGWWLALCAWTIGLIASSATLLVQSGWLTMTQRLPMTHGQAVSWAISTVAVGALAVLALAVLISTSSAVALVAMLLLTALTGALAVRGARRPIAPRQGDR